MPKQCYGTIYPESGSPVRIKNPSPASIYSESRLSFDAGIDFTHMFNERWGYQAGLDVGMADWIYGFKAPRSAFETKTGEGEIWFEEGFDKYLYNAISANVVHRFSWKRTYFNVIVGSGLRYYHGEIDPTIWEYGFNRAVPYDLVIPIQTHRIWW